MKQQKKNSATGSFDKKDKPPIDKCKRAKKAETSNMGHHNTCMLCMDRTEQYMIVLVPKRRHLKKVFTSQ